MAMAQDGSSGFMAYPSQSKPSWYQTRWLRLSKRSLLLEWLPRGQSSGLLQHLESCRRWPGKEETHRLSPKFCVWAVSKPLVDPWTVGVWGRPQAVQLRLKSWMKMPAAIHCREDRVWSLEHSQVPGMLQQTTKHSSRKCNRILSLCSVSFANVQGYPKLVNIRHRRTLPLLKRRGHLWTTETDPKMSQMIELVGRHL